MEHGEIPVTPFAHPGMGFPKASRARDGRANLGTLPVGMMENRPQPTTKPTTGKDKPPETFAVAEVPAVRCSP